MISKKKSMAIGLLLAAVVISVGFYNYIYQPHRNIATEKIDFQLDPQKLKSAMSNTASAKEYIDKVIQTRGKITSVDQNSVIIDGIIQVNFELDSKEYLNPNNDLEIKGRCIGYDDLLELVKIDQATIIN